MRVGPPQPEARPKPTSGGRVTSYQTQKSPSLGPYFTVSGRAFFEFGIFAAAFADEFPRYFWRSCRPKRNRKASPKVQRNGEVSAARNRRDRPEIWEAGAAQLLRISALVRFSGWCGGIWSACRVSSGGVQPRHGARSAVPSGGKGGVSRRLQVGRKSVIAVEFARVFDGDLRSAGGAGSGAGFRRGWASARRRVVPMDVRSAFSASGSGGAVAVSEQRRGASGGAAAVGARKRRGCADYRRAEPWASLRVSPRVRTLLTHANY
eukprot:COSAG06_NODE_6107_length_3106_cov_4.787496_2_plen_264_part_00